MSSVYDRLRGKKALITGGLGMIGSTIALQLVRHGATVTLVDACLEPYGSNRFNIEPIRDSVTVEIADIRSREAMQRNVREKDIIFNLAGQVSHNDSMNDPLLDADINYIGHLNVLECVRRVNPKAVLLHAGSRLQFGRIERVPVNETQPMRPRTPYATDKAAAELMYLFFREIHGVPCVLFRIANPYGPRSQMKHSKYSMINWFIRQAMQGETIRVYGDGSQLRDYIYVEDLADAFIRASVTDACMGEVFNVGSGVATSFREMAESIVHAVGSGRVEFVPWPAEYVNVETGDYVTDLSKIRKLTSWEPRTALADGIARTCEFYREHARHYW
jgi:UDP-glucose 4-epimerase